MYMTIDIASPVHTVHLANMKAKNRILQYWPRQWVVASKLEGYDGPTENGYVECFYKLLMYYEGSFPYTEEHKKIYQLLGIDLWVDLMQQDYSGLRVTYLDFKYVPPSSFDIDDTLLFNYAVNSTQLDTWYTTTLNLQSKDGAYDPFNPGEVIPPPGEERRDYIDGKLAVGFSLADFDIAETESPVDFIALQDVNEVLFDRVVTVNINKIEQAAEDIYAEDFVHRYERPVTTYTTNITVKYKRKPDTTIGECAALFVRVEASDYLNDQLFADTHALDIDSVYYRRTISAAGTGEDAGIPALYEWYLPVNSVEAMKPKDFAAVMKRAVNSGYIMEKADGWAKVLALVVLIIAIILSFFVGFWAMGTLQGLGALGAFASAAALTMTMGILVQTLIVKALQNQGEYGNAMVFGKSIVILQALATVMGFIALFAGVLQLATSQAITTGTVGLDGVSSQTVTLASSPLAIGQTILGWLNTGFNQYSQSEAGKDASEAQTLEDQVAAQDEAMALMSTPKSYELIQQYFENYDFLDMNKKMENYPWQVTEGKIVMSTTKYFT